MTGFVAVMDGAELASGHSHCVDVAGQRLLIARTDLGVFATAAFCSHARLPLEGARVRGGALLCPHHGARFDLRTGAAMGPPAFAGIATYPARERDGRIEVMLP